MKKYWKKFYENFDIKEPSDFARFCAKYIPKDSIVLDVGCGNGRDSYFLATNNRVIGIDYAIQPEDGKNVLFLKADLFKFIRPINSSLFDVVYSRFLLNTLTNGEIERFIKWIGGVFMVECRAEGDEPKLYPNHKRNFINGEWLLGKLINEGFEITLYQKSRGLSKFRGEDPLLIRVIARKKDEKN